MNDELPRDFKPIDPGRVNTMDPVERRWWCLQLNCTEGELDEAIDAAGEHVTEVREQLARRR